MRTNTFEAIVHDLELLFSRSVPSEDTVRLAFAGIAAMAVVWFL